MEQQGMAKLLAKKMDDILQATMVELGQQSLLWVEAAILRKVYHRIRLKLPLDKFIQSCNRVNRCLCKLVKMQMGHKLHMLHEKIIQQVCTHTSCVKDEGQSELGKVLLSVQEASVLLAVTAAHCTETFLHILQRLRVGHLIPNLIVVAAGIARISVLCKSLLFKFRDLYSLSLQLLHQRREDWINQNNDEKLPDDLWTFLGPDLQPAFYSLTSLSAPDRKNLKFLEKMFKGEYESRDVCDENTKKGLSDGNNNVEDLGEPLSRQQFSHCLVHKTVKKKTTLKSSDNCECFNRYPMDKLFVRVKTMKSLSRVWRKLSSCKCKKNGCLALYMTEEQTLKGRKVLRYTKKKILQLKRSKQNAEVTKVIQLASKKLHKIVSLQKKINV
ncbi:uncharacterized protein LOC143223004 [Tachypleus tridentatus]|uniref:uncharacterized protein LOC143223004 n=1 Tax=Tachypleus tridentatus TaxID=6853 RepID=UPI003FD3C912